MRRLPVETIFFTTFAMSSGAMNCPFLTLTTAPVSPAASRRSVCRARNAGIWITSQAAAKALGSFYGQRVIDVQPPLVLPSFPRARLVPFGVGAAGRYGMSSLSHIRSLLGLLGRPGGASAYLNLLSTFDSDAFRAAAEAWYSTHGHRDADGCRPPASGTERGGGTPYGI